MGLLTGQSCKSAVGALWGAQGQRIYVDPRSKLVMMNTAAQECYDFLALRETNALWSALVRQLGS